MTIPAEVEIEGVQVGGDHATYVIAEVGLAHDGSLGSALAFVDAAAQTGVQAVKFQTHIPEAESTVRERFRVPVFPQDQTRFDYWKRTAFSLAQWQQIQSRARTHGLSFLSSPFSLEAVDLLMEVGVPAWKVGSGEVSNLPLLDRMADTGLPILLSSGMSDWAELDRCAKLLDSARAPWMLFQCTSRYPCPPEEWGLNLIPEMSARYGVPVGFSDHSGRVAAGIAARVMGASAVEVHLTFHRQAFGPDVPASLTPEELSQLVADLDAVDRARSHPVSKDAAAAEFSGMRELFTKSIVAARDLRDGHLLEGGDMALKKPGDGLPPEMMKGLVGRVLRRSVKLDERILQEDLE
ncbi:MAG: N-acetylneuraminate synthase family protein [Gemmatimonadota bacterium]